MTALQTLEYTRSPATRESALWRWLLKALVGWACIEFLLYSVALGPIIYDLFSASPATRSTYLAFAVRLAAEQTLQLVFALFAGSVAGYSLHRYSTSRCLRWGVGLYGVVTLVLVVINLYHNVTLTLGHYSIWGINVDAFAWRLIVLCFIPWLMIAGYPHREDDQRLPFRIHQTSERLLVVAAFIIAITTTQNIAFRGNVIESSALTNAIVLAGYAISYLTAASILFSWFFDRHRLLAIATWGLAIYVVLDLFFALSFRLDADAQSSIGSRHSAFTYIQILIIQLFKLLLVSLVPIVMMRLNGMDYRKEHPAISET